VGVCIHLWLLYTETYEHFLPRLIHTLPLYHTKANNLSSTCVRSMCKSHDLLKSNWGTSRQYAVDKQARFNQKNWKLNKPTNNHPRPLISSDYIKFSISLNLVLRPYIAVKKSRFSFVNPIFSMYPPWNVSSICIWNYNQGLFQGQEWTILCSISLITDWRLLHY